MRTICNWNKPVEQPSEAPSPVMRGMLFTTSLPRRFRELPVGCTSQLVNECWNILIPAIPDWFFFFEKPYKEFARR